MDEYRKDLLHSGQLITNLNPQTTKSLRILHVTNFNERHNGRLFFNTGRRLNNGLVRMGHSVLEFSDRDIQKHYKSLNDFDGSKKLNEKLIVTCYNFKPDLILAIGGGAVIDYAKIANVVDIKDNLKDLIVNYYSARELSQIDEGHENAY